ncbi:hypothetical protein [Jiella sonneratiae]|uniref:Secreted protein n=1 Tax=Jiella sonneratiae TaxID=2816856 RepID=A0ABS3J1Q9_9HYPH|nr:hypothetical protein [Jiella sonneratiae]MBO0903070.1 hypothetical protein [Jiella sonneratiae]
MRRRDGFAARPRRSRAAVSALSALSLALSLSLVGARAPVFATEATGETGSASAAVLADPALTAAFSGRDLEGVYADATPWSEAYASDGTLSYRDRIGLWAGDWSVMNGRFCTFYRDQGITGGCFLVARRGENCFDFYAVDETSGPGVPTADILAGRNWTARGWYVESEPSCPQEERHLVGL